MPRLGIVFDYEYARATVRRIGTIGHQPG
jgi:hypothetical protein